MNKKLTEHFICSSCGSADVELKSCIDNGISSFIGEFLFSLCKCNRMLAGRKYLVCKSCGHKTVIQIL